MAGVPLSGWFAIWDWQAWKHCAARWFPRLVRFPFWIAQLFISKASVSPARSRFDGRYRGKHVMLIGVTGFIGKVWLVNTLMELPDIGRIYLLIRRQKSNPAMRRFEKLVEESPVFDPLYERYGSELARFLRERVEVVEGDVCQPGLGLAPELAQSLQKNLDLIINS